METEVLGGLDEPENPDVFVDWLKGESPRVSGIKRDFRRLVSESVWTLKSCLIEMITRFVCAYIC